VTRRMVLLHTTGPYAGIYQINGAADIPNDAMPTSLEVRMMDEDMKVVELRTMGERMVVYREAEV
jgi:hypothetical protein